MKIAARLAERSTTSCFARGFLGKCFSHDQFLRHSFLHHKLRSSLP